MKRYDYHGSTRYSESRMEEHPFGLYVTYPTVEQLLAVVEAARGMRAECRQFGMPLLATVEDFDAAIAKLDGEGK